MFSSAAKHHTSQLSCSYTFKATIYTEDVSGLELRAKVDLAARFVAVDQDEVCVMWIEKTLVRRFVLLRSLVIDRIRRRRLKLRRTPKQKQTHASVLKTSVYTCKYTSMHYIQDMQKAQLTQTNRESFEVPTDVSACSSMLFVEIGYS